MTRVLAAALLGALLLEVPAASAQSRGSGSRASPARTRAIRAELAEVLLQSKQYDEAAREYRALLHAEPENRAYRLNLARALAWGRRFREAEDELRILASRQPGNPTVEALLVTVRQALSPSAAEAAQWVEERPASAEYRRVYARALAREGRVDEALKQYDLLLPQQRSAQLLLERAYIHVEQRNHAEAETDLFASIAMGATVDALLMLGDLRRWRGDLGSAHKLFSHARSIAPASSDVAAAFARLARDERPAAAFIPQASDAPGWQTTSTTTSDNLGALLTTVAVRHGFKAQRLEGSAGVKALRLSDHLVGGDDLPPIAGTQPTTGTGFGADIAVSGEAAYRELYGRARVRGGVVHHPDADMVSDAGLTLATWWRAWGAGLEISTAPAYPSLVTMASFVPLEGTETQLQERATAFSLAGPVRRLDVALRNQITTFNDGNRRDAFEAFARYPLFGQLAVLYSGSSLGFAQPSPLYWDPVRYIVHSGGLEYALRRWRGASFAARALPGVAWSTDRPATDPDSTVHTVSPQLAGGLEWTYKGDHWELGATLGYGRGRTGSYERFDGAVQVRYAP